MTESQTKPSQRKSRQVKRRLISRLVGMETEYATLIINQDNSRHADLPASHSIYTAICDAIRRDQPTAVGLFDAEQMFLASGGAVTFESHPSMHATPGGLIEIATPEVRSPSELLACQRSIDLLVQDAAANIDLDIDLRILKNSSDALGHVYGCQENYETVVASGIWLLIYRVSVCLLWLLQAVCLLASLPILGLILVIVLVFRFFKGGLWQFVRDPNEMFELVPRWLSGLMIGALRWIHMPTVIALRFVARHIAFRSQRKYLTSFLVSRVALTGSGDLDHDGLYRLSAKAMATDSLADMGGFRGERPIFVYGHWLGQFCARSFLSLGSTIQMFRKRQRLQIGLSDSSLSDLSEYVKVGSVSLLLDMIENCHTKGLPILKHPVDALHRIGSDWNLVSRVATNRGGMSAIDIQKAYIKTARQFVDSVSGNYRGEAPLVLRRWQELLDCVVEFRRDANAVQESLGRVDWLTKRWMIDQLGNSAVWTEKKKVDLRYHELSSDGYFSQLQESRPELKLVDEEQIFRRRRSPPPGSPAARRGWLIREFAGGEESLQAEWTHAVIGQGRKRRRIEFAQTKKISDQDA